MAQVVYDTSSTRATNATRKPVIWRSSARDRPNSIQATDRLNIGKRR